MAKEMDFLTQAGKDLSATFGVERTITFFNKRQNKNNTSFGKIGFCSFTMSGSYVSAIVTLNNGGQKCLQ